MTSSLFVTLDFSPSLIADGLSTQGLSAQMRLCSKGHCWDTIYDDGLSFLELHKWALYIANEMQFLSKGAKWMIQKVAIGAKQATCRSSRANKKAIKQ